MLLKCGILMSFGERLRKARKSLKLTQEQFAQPLAITRGYIACLENGLQKPSEALLKLISAEHCISITWLKTGTGEMFISPEDGLKSLTARYGEQAVLKAVNNIMKECGLAVATIRQAHRSDTGDPDLDNLVNILYDLWAAGDNDMKGWLKVQFRRAFPDDIIKEAQKKQKATQSQVSAS